MSHMYTHTHTHKHTHAHTHTHTHTPACSNRIFASSWTAPCVAFCRCLRFSQGYALLSSATCCRVCCLVQMPAV